MCIPQTNSTTRVPLQTDGAHLCKKVLDQTVWRRLQFKWRSEHKTTHNVVVTVLSGDDTQYISQINQRPRLIYAPRRIQKDPSVRILISSHKYTFTCILEIDTDQTWQYQQKNMGAVLSSVTHSPSQTTAKKTPHDFPRKDSVSWWTDGNYRRAREELGVSWTAVRSTTAKRRTLQNSVQSLMIIRD